MDDCAEFWKWGETSSGERAPRSRGCSEHLATPLPLEYSLLQESVIVSAQDFGTVAKAKCQEETELLFRDFVQWWDRTGRKHMKRKTPASCEGSMGMSSLRTHEDKNICVLELGTSIPQGRRLVLSLRKRKSVRNSVEKSKAICAMEDLLCPTRSGSIGFSRTEE